MQDKDPFRYLPFDCAGLVLQHLSPRELAICERVNTRWKDCLREWIAAVGLRMHYPHSGTGLNPIDATRKFKTLPGREKHFRLGKIGSTREVTNSKHLCIAGDYAAWFVDGGISWQYLARQSNGSLFPVKMLYKFNPSIKASTIIQGLHVNADGYLFVRATERIGDVVEYQDTVLALETGNKIWSRHPPNFNNYCAAEIPLFMGRDRLYYQSNIGDLDGLAAYGVKTGEMIYNVPTGVNLVQKIEPVLLQSPGKDYILHVMKNMDIPDAILEPRFGQGGQPATIFIFNGANGDLTQRLKCDIWDDPYFSLGEDGARFAIVSRLYGEREFIKIQKFEESRGIFSSRCIEVIELENLHHEFIAVDAFRHLGCAIEYKGSPPVIFSLTDPLDPSEHNVLARNLARYDHSISLDRLFHAKGITELAVGRQPTKEKITAKKNLSSKKSKYRPSDEETETTHWMFLVDGLRILLHRSRNRTRIDYLVDFTPKGLTA